MIISDDRLTSPKHLAFLQKLLDPHYWSADDGKVYKPDVVVLREASERQPMPGDLIQVVVEVISPNENIGVYTLDGDEYRPAATVAANARTEFAEPFPFVLDMKQINS